MGKITINKNIVDNDKQQEIKIKLTDGKWSFKLYSNTQEYLYNKIIMVEDVKSDIPYLNADTLFFMIKQTHYEQIEDQFCYEIDSFIVSTTSIPEDFYKQITEITLGSFECNVDEPVNAQEVIANSGIANFEEEKFYLQLSEGKYQKYITNKIVGDNAIDYSNSSRVYSSLILGQTYKDDIVIYKIGDNQYYKFNTNKPNPSQGIYNGCSKYTKYTYEQFHTKYRNQSLKEICDEYIHFALKEKQGKLPERKLIFLRQVEYIIFFFKEDPNLRGLLQKYNITEHTNNMSNLNIIIHVLNFYNNGEYDNGLFGKFTSFVNDIDETVISYIANEIIILRNGIAHINEGSIKKVNYQYFDLISEISYLMLLKYLGVVFINNNAPVLHAGTVVPLQINISKSNQVCEVLKPEKKPVVTKAKEQKSQKKTPVKKNAYKFFPHGYLEKLDKQSYVVMQKQAFSNVEQIIKSQNIAIALDGNVNVDSELRALVTDNADVLYSNSNKKYKNVINKNKSKLIVFINRKQIVVPKKHINMFTHKNKIS